MSNALPQKYIDLGLSIIPIGTIEIVTDGNGKPRKKIQYPPSWKEYETRRATIEEASAWTLPNIGIVTGDISGILVLDLDEYKPTYDRELVRSWQLPITPTVQTARGGHQMYFRLPPGLNIRNDAGIFSSDSCIDIRCDGGMVIAPPTKTSYGEYTWIISPEDTPFAPIPKILLDLLLSKTRQGKPKKDMSQLVGIAEGEGRNNAMASFIGKIIANMDELNWGSDAWHLASAVNNTYNPPLDQEELKTIYYSITRIEHDRRMSVARQAPVIQEGYSLTNDELLAYPCPDVEYYLDQLIEKSGVIMVSAPPNSFKTWMLFSFIHSIVTGQKALGNFDTMQTGVMIVNEEDPLPMVKERVVALGMKQPGLPIHWKISNGSKIDKKYTDAMIAECKAKNIGIVTFDSFRAVSGADENSSGEVQLIMDQFKRMAREGLTVIFTHHNRKKMFGKTDSSSDMDSARGSSALTAAITGMLSFDEKNDEDGHRLVIHHLKSKVTKKLAPFDVNIVETGSSKTKDLKMSFEYVGLNNSLSLSLRKGEDQILEYLKANDGKYISRFELERQSFVGDKTFKNAISALTKRGNITSITGKEILTRQIRVNDKKVSPQGKFYTFAGDITPEQSQTQIEEMDF